MKAAFILIALFNLQIKAISGTKTYPELILRDTFPVPDVKNLLFYVQRNLNSNTVIYQLNLNQSNELNQELPISIYWIRYSEGGSKERLTWVQRKYAYGLKIKQIKANEFELRFAAYPNLVFYLLYSAEDNEHLVYGTLESHNFKLTRIFVNIEGGTLVNPAVTYVEFDGIDLDSGQPMSHRFIP